MAEDASEALGAPEVAGAFVRPSGSSSGGLGIVLDLLARPLVGPVASLVAGAIWSRFSVESGRLRRDAPYFGELGYLALTDDEIAIVEAKVRLGRRVGEQVVTRVPRADLVWAELEAAELEIDFVDGRRWRLRVAERRKAEPLVRALRASLL